MQLYFPLSSRTTYCRLRGCQHHCFSKSMGHTKPAEKPPST